MSETFWLVEMQGPAYLAARHLGGYEFYWTNDWTRAIRFASREQGDLVMMSVRQLRGDLFPACLTRVPCAVEHGFADGRLISRGQPGGHNSYAPDAASMG